MPSITFRASDEFTQSVDDWAKAHGLTRSKAIVAIVNTHLASLLPPLSPEEVKRHMREITDWAKGGKLTVV